MDRCAVKPYEGGAPYIFVSYSHRDKAVVFPIIERFARDGYRVWYDEGIDPGSEWSEIIADHLNECALCLAFISSESLASDYCRREINYALSKKKNLISIMLEKVELSSGMEMQLSANQSVFRYLYADEEEFYEKLYSAKYVQECKGKEDAIANPPVSAQTVARSSADKRHKLNFLFAIGIGVVLIALVIVILILLLDGNERDRSDEVSGAATTTTSAPIKQPDVTFTPLTEDPSSQAFLDAYMKLLEGESIDEVIKDPNLTPEQIEELREYAEQLTDKPIDLPESTPEVPSVSEPETPSVSDPDDPSVSANEVLTVNVDGIIDQGDQKVIALSFDNQTGSSVRFFDANVQCVLRITTDSGEYSAPLDVTDYVEAIVSAGKSYRTFKAGYAPGEVKQIVLTYMSVSFDTLANVEIYNAEKGISACVCDFASESVSEKAGEWAAVVKPESDLEPQDDALLIRVDGIIDQGSRKTIAVSYVNKTGRPVEWAWAQGAYLTVTTDVGDYMVEEAYNSEIAVGNSVAYFTIENCPGQISTVTMNELCRLKENGLPDRDRFLFDVLIYDAESGLSATVCWDS